MITWGALLVRFRNLFRRAPVLCPYCSEPNHPRAYHCQDCGMWIDARATGELDLITMAELIPHMRPPDSGETLRK